MTLPLMIRLSVLLLVCPICLYICIVYLIVKARLLDDVMIVCTGGPGG